MCCLCVEVYVCDVYECTSEGTWNMYESNMHSSIYEFYKIYDKLLHVYFLNNYCDNEKERIEDSIRFLLF